VDFAAGGGWTVQEAVEPGAEVLVGVTTDATFGPVLTVGVGGMLVEALAETSSRVMPVDAGDVRRMVGETALGRLLETDRRGARDVESLVATVLAFQESVLSGDDVVEAELNPVIVGAVGTGSRIVDARIGRR
jgi:acetate---CoA ligase (ADP-forming)